MCCWFIQTLTVHKQDVRHKDAINNLANQGAGIDSVIKAEEIGISKRISIEL